MLIYESFFFDCLYECYGIKLETTYKQAPKTGLKKNISQGKERELNNIQFLRRSPSSRLLLSEH